MWVVPAARVFLQGSGACIERGKPTVCGYYSQEIAAQGTKKKICDAGFRHDFDPATTRL